MNTSVRTLSAADPLKAFFAPALPNEERTALKSSLCLGAGGRGIAVTLAWVFLAGAASTAGAASLYVPTVEVGNPDNPESPISGFGDVGYDYRIGTYEVTNSQYASFLNQVASNDPFALYNSNMGSAATGGILRSGTAGNFSYAVKSGYAYKPVNYVSFWDAARFANWLTTGDTEVGVYLLDSVTNPVNSSITRNAEAWQNGGVAIAGRDEWFKAAYYAPGPGGPASGYWACPGTDHRALPEPGLVGAPAGREAI